MASLQGPAYWMQVILLIADKGCVVVKVHLPEPLIGNSIW